MQMKSYSISASFSHPFPFPFSFIFLTFARWSGQHLSEVHADEDLQHVSVVFSSFSISILFHFVTPSPGGVASIWARGVQMKSYSISASFSHSFSISVFFYFSHLCQVEWPATGQGACRRSLTACQGLFLNLLLTTPHILSHLHQVR